MSENRPSQFPTLSTKRLRLRKIRHDDLEEIYQLRTNPIIARFLHRPKTESRQEASDFISKTLKDDQEGTSIYWCLIPDEEQSLIGSVCLWNFSDNGKVAEIGFELFPKYQGMGFMAEASEAVIEYGFSQLGLNSIEAITHRDNLNSIRLLLNLGFKVNEQRSDAEHPSVIFLEKHSA